METAISRRARSDGKVSMRIPQQTKELIERAAASMNKSFSAFVIDCARDHAQEVLNQTPFSLSAEQTEAIAQVI